MNEIDNEEFDNSLAEIDNDNIEQAIVEENINLYENLIIH